MRVLCGVAGALVVLVGGATGQDAVTFKSYAYKVGDKTRTVTTEDTTSATTFAAGGKQQTKNEKKKKSLVYVTEVLAVGPDATQPAKRRRTYEKAVEVVNGVETELPLHDKTVTIERSGDKYTFSADGEPLDAAALKALEGEFNKKGKLDDNDFFPKDGVKVGEFWDLTEKFLKEIDTPESPFVLARKQAVVTGSLLSTTKKGGSTFGDIRISADLPLTELRGQLTIKLNPGSAMKLTMKGDGAIDGTSPEGTMSMTMRIILDGTAPGVAVKANSEIKTVTRTDRVGAGKR